MAHVVSNNSNDVSTMAAIEKRRSLVPATWDSTTVRTVGIAECGPAGVSLAHAFAADALSLYLLDGDSQSTGVSKYTDEQRWKQHVRIMTYLVSAHCSSGLVTTIGQDYDCVALWLPPGKHLDDWWTILRSGMWRLYYQLGAEGRKRYYADVLPLLHSTIDEVMGDRPFYYLGYIGTRPNARGKGYAKKLILHMAAKADAENLPMYLESSAKSNMPYYEKFGFKFVKEISFKRGPTPIPLYVMVREPDLKKADNLPSLGQVETITLTNDSGNQQRRVKE